MKAREGEASFTGRHMLAIMFVFFGVIIAVNVTMATFANTSWTGFVVENSYVASQQFNTKMAETRAQAALGWKSALSLNEGRASFSLRDRDGNDIALQGVVLTFKHPVGAREDVRIVLKREGENTYRAEEPVGDGTWLVEIEADSGRAKPYRETLRIHVRQGSWA